MPRRTKEIAMLSSLNRRKRMRKKIRNKRDGGSSLTVM